MSLFDEIRNIRIQKLENLKAQGLNPYPSKSFKDFSLKEAIDDFENLVQKKEKKWLNFSLKT